MQRVTIVSRTNQEIMCSGLKITTRGITMTEWEYNQLTPTVKNGLEEFQRKGFISIGLSGTLIEDGNVTTFDVGDAAQSPESFAVISEAASKAEVNASEAKSIAETGGADATSEARSVAIRTESEIELSNDEISEARSVALLSASEAEVASRAASEARSVAFVQASEAGSLANISASVANYAESIARVAHPAGAGLWYYGAGSPEVPGTFLVPSQGLLLLGDATPTISTLTVENRLIDGTLYGGITAAIMFYDTYAYGLDLSTPKTVGALIVSGTTTGTGDYTSIINDAVDVYTSNDNVNWTLAHSNVHGQLAHAVNFQPAVKWLLPSDVTARFIKLVKVGGNLEMVHVGAYPLQVRQIRAFAGYVLVGQAGDFYENALTGTVFYKDDSEAWGSIGNLSPSLASEAYSTGLRGQSVARRAESQGALDNSLADRGLSLSRLALSLARIVP